MASKPGTVPLIRAHAHNDGKHERPLQDALTNRFASVEADVCLRDGEIFVAHDPDDCVSGKTLAAVYLEPLRARVSKHGGAVIPGHPEFVLLVDVQTEAEETYQALTPVLKRYDDILTVWADGGTRPGAVTAIITGERSRAIMASESVRYAAYDGMLDELGSETPVSFMPLISDDWTEHFTWTGHGAMPAEDRARLRSYVEAAHGEGRRIRFWSTPDQPGAGRDALWRTLLDADVDLINTDDLDGLRRFLSAWESRA